MNGVDHMVTSNIRMWSALLHDSHVALAKAREKAQTALDREIESSEQAIEPHVIFSKRLKLSQEYYDWRIDKAPKNCSIADDALNVLSWLDSKGLLKDPDNTPKEKVVMQTCPKCGGSGDMPHVSHGYPCDRCGGHGKLRKGI